jgi:hypothetical protein
VAIGVEAESLVRIVKCCRKCVATQSVKEPPRESATGIDIEEEVPRREWRGRIGNSRLDVSGVKPDVRQAGSVVEYSTWDREMGRFSERLDSEEASVGCLEGRSIGGCCNSTGDSLLNAKQADRAAKTAQEGMF